MPTFTISISDDDPAKVAALAHALTDNPKLDEILSKINAMSADDRAELAAFRAVALPTMVNVSNQLNVFTPNA